MVTSEREVRTAYLEILHIGAQFFLLRGRYPCLILLFISSKAAETLSTFSLFIFTANFATIPRYTGDSIPSKWQVENISKFFYQLGYIWYE